MGREAGDIINSPNCRHLGFRDEIGSILRCSSRFLSPGVHTQYNPLPLSMRLRCEYEEWLPTGDMEAAGFQLTSPLNFDCCVTLDELAVY